MNFPPEQQHQSNINEIYEKKNLEEQKKKKII